MKPSAKNNNQVAQPLPAKVPSKGSGLMRWLIVGVAVLVTASASWAVLEFVVWNRLPDSLVGRWEVVEGPSEYKEAEFSFYRGGKLIVEQSPNIVGSAGLMLAQGASAGCQSASDPSYTGQAQVRLQTFLSALGLDAQTNELGQRVRELRAVSDFQRRISSIDLDESEEIGGTDIVERQGDLTVATLHIDYHGLKHNFTTRNQNTPGGKIDMLLVDGPFRHLEGVWQFIPLADYACKVEFRLEYEFSSQMLEKVVGPVFSKIANTFVDAFVKRAEKVYAR